MFPMSYEVESNTIGFGVWSLVPKLWRPPEPSFRSESSSRVYVGHSRFFEKAALRVVFEFDHFPTSDADGTTFSRSVVVDIPRIPSFGVIGVVVRS